MSSVSSSHSDSGSCSGSLHGSRSSESAHSVRSDEYGRFSEVVKRSDKLSLKIQELAHNDMFDDATHHKLANRVRELYQITCMARPAPTMTENGRMNLLAAGMALQKHAYAADARKDELLRTLLLLAIVSFAGGMPPPNEVQAAVEDDQYAQYIHANDLQEGNESKLLSRLQHVTNALEIMCHRHNYEYVAQLLRYYERLSENYFKSTALMLRSHALSTATPRKVAPWRSEEEIKKDPRALAIVEAADAELGQMAFRDTMLSFKVTAESIGQRRTLLLNRDQTRIIEEKHADEMNAAHSAAMQSPSDVWENGTVMVGVNDSAEVVGDFLQPETNVSNTDASNSFTTVESQQDNEVEQICSLLAGLAMNISESVEEARSGTAFSGRVELPFLTTSPPPPTVSRITLHNGTWYYYRLKVNSNQLMVELSGVGVAGLLACCVAMLDEKQ